MSSVPAFFDQYPISELSTSDSWGLLVASVRLATKRNHIFVTPIHLFLTFWSMHESEARLFLLDQDLDPDVIIFGLEELLQELPTTSTIDTSSMQETFKPRTQQQQQHVSSTTKASRRSSPPLQVSLGNCGIQANALYNTSNGIYKRPVSSPSSLYRQYLKQKHNHEVESLLQELTCIAAQQQHQQDDDEGNSGSNVSTRSSTMAPPPLLPPQLSESMNWFVHQLQILADSDYKSKDYTDFWNQAIMDPTLNMMDVDLQDLLVTARLAFTDEEEDQLLVC
ncbi:hypothetical protein H4219_005218 [Mycoemilia scoparia]|uniref:Uncharacterized protein n=1 Tax=Mycoemilia scoparia TaxID=417184 RepID=A0A9W8DK92_9FUNG|nr:hypothetical protein H4219_005218 [Mycoemilia scoparia]